jgi:hypothetical protein
MKIIILIFLFLSVLAVNEWHVLFPNEEYNKFKESEKQIFTGIIQKFEPTEEVSFIQRFNPYKLQTQDGKTIDIYIGVDEKELNSYLGKKVSLKGKIASYELEGSQVVEIVPSDIKLE